MIRCRRLHWPSAFCKSFISRFMRLYGALRRPSISINSVAKARPDATRKNPVQIVEPPRADFRQPSSLQAPRHKILIKKAGQQTRPFRPIALSAMQADRLTHTRIPRLPGRYWVNHPFRPNNPGYAAIQACPRVEASGAYCASDSRD